MIRFLIQIVSCVGEATLARRIVTQSCHAAHVSRGKNRTANRVRQGGPYGVALCNAKKGACNGLVKNSMRLVA